MPAIHILHNLLCCSGVVIDFNIIILSDFLVPPFDEEIRMLSKKHEIILLQCFDDAERGMSLDGVYEICDPETGEFLLLDANSPKTRAALGDYYLDLGHRLETLSEQTKTDFLSLSVEDDYLQRLVHFFRRRGPSHL